MPHTDVVLEYRDPADEPKRPHPALALTLCAAGLMCWTIFLLGAFGLVRLPTSMVAMIFVLWGLAAITATASLFLYLVPWKQPRPWFVVLNLAVNITGL